MLSARRRSRDISPRPNIEVRANTCRKLDEFRLRVNQPLRPRNQVLVFRLLCSLRFAVDYPEGVSCGDETSPMLWVGQPARFMFRMKEEFYGARYALMD